MLRIRNTPTDVLTIVLN